MPRPSALRCFVPLAIRMALLCAQTSLLALSEIPVGGYQVSGTVVNKIGGHPLAGARVVVGDARNRDRVVSMVTADDGRFTFHVPAGKYSLGAEKRGFLPTSYKGHEQFSTAIVTGAGFDTESLVIHLAPTAVLRGKVIDEAGEPVRNANVTVYRESRESGISQIQPVLQSTTNDQGTYEATPLNDGTYFVSVRAKPWYAVHGQPSRGAEGTMPAMVDSSLDVAYPTTYYGDVTESDDATPIPIRGGDKVEADIHVGPVPSLHIVVHMGEEDRTRGSSMPMFQKQSFDGMERLETGQVNGIAPGVFEITGIPAGHYTVQQFGGPRMQVNEPSEIELSSTSSDLDMSSGSPASTVKVKVQVVGESKVPVPMRIAMRNSKGRVASIRPVSAEGEATFTNVSTGEYNFTAGSPNKPYSVRIASTNGVTEGRKLNVSSGSSLEVTLSLIGGEVTVEGVAQRASKPFSGAMVVLVPKDHDLKREFFRRDQSDMDGTFSLLQVFPGNYTVIAIEDGWDLDWGKPEVLAQYTKHGQSITVGGQAKGSSQLAEPVEVLPK
jgi:5-hydroxyisourate hydrolase-like protein (transthyretin family)